MATLSAIIDQPPDQLTMYGNEDFAFAMETSLGERQIIISRTALHLIGGTSPPEKVVQNHATALRARVERKIARGRVAVDEAIRLHGTDL